MQNPSVMSSVQAKVRDAFMGKTEVTEEGLGKLSYLQCVIKETLRLHAPGPLLLPRECQEPCTILGCDVPRGTIVIVNNWAISRDPEYWDEPETFIPDRFMGRATDYKGNNFEFTPFGSVGRRISSGPYGALTISPTVRSAGDSFTSLTSTLPLQVSVPKATTMSSICTVCCTTTQSLVLVLHSCSSFHVRLCTC
jgi:hypothetical protein